MITYILAIVFFAQGADTAPVIIGPMADHETCMIEARKFNTMDKALHRPDVRKLGGEYACLKIIRDYI